ncbi:GNAT family N-acetyltransferase [Thermoactinomyces sp. CICC 10522]|nr:GNAT family N-acetyltransferase [Thermoactinomyces sp. CICC 10522]
MAGFICGGKIRSQQPVQTGEVYALYLLQEVQRQQLGTRLMRQLAESLQKQGCNSLVVYVIKDNPARRFYEKLGAIPVNSETSWIGDQEVEEIRYEWVSLDSLLKKAEQSTTHQ